MPKSMLIDASHPEETRVVVVNDRQLEEFDFESSNKRQLKGNIYLAKVTRVEPSLQAAFVDYGGDRHGFLAFSEIHPDYFQIPQADRHLIDEVSRAEPEAAEDDATSKSNGKAENGEQRAANEKPDSENTSDDNAEGADDAATPPAPLAQTPLEQSLSEPVDDEPAPAQTAGTEPEDSGAQAMDGSAEPATDTEDDGDAEDEAVDEDGDDGSSEDVATDPDEEAEEVFAEQARRRQRLLRNYKIQEVIKRRQIILVQVVKEERGNKGAALTTYLSLAGRYCVLMPNTARGGGISRKIANVKDRARLKTIARDLDVPEGMGLIVRTAGQSRNKLEIRRDYDYLLRLWSDIRDRTLGSIAPCTIYEEGALIKRAIRDIYDSDIGEILVEGDDGYKSAKKVMTMLMPSRARRVKQYREEQPLFHHFQIEPQLDALHSPIVELRSGGSIVINPTEALTSIDVNSGRATRERNIEETALRTNAEAAEEIARQLRLRDVAGLVVIDFIDMVEMRNQRIVERRLRDALRFDRARIQLGRISAFGLLELSRQRLRPSFLELSTQPCPVCAGSGTIRSVESAALQALRAVEVEGMKGHSKSLAVTLPLPVALYLLNQKRDRVASLEQRYSLTLEVRVGHDLIAGNLKIDMLDADPEVLAEEQATARKADRQERARSDQGRNNRRNRQAAPRVEEQDEAAEEEQQQARTEASDDEGDSRQRKRRRRRRRRRSGSDAETATATTASAAAEQSEADEQPAGGDTAAEEAAASEDGAARQAAETGQEDEAPRSGRRRRRSSRGRRRGSASRDRAAETQSAEGAVVTNGSGGEPAPEEPSAAPDQQEAADQTHQTPPAEDQPDHDQQPSEPEQPVLAEPSSVPASPEPEQPVFSEPSSAEPTLPTTMSVEPSQVPKPSITEVPVMADHPAEASQASDEAEHGRNGTPVDEVEPEEPQASEDRSEPSPAFIAETEQAAPRRGWWNRFVRK